MYILFQLLIKLNIMTKLIPKCQYNGGNAFGKLTERNDATTVRPVYFP
jgi:hypothetical protein